MRAPPVVAFLSSAVSRLRLLAHRRRRAAKLGVTYRRAASFSLPGKLWTGTTYKSLLLPRERGVRVAFADLLLDDCYGLESLPDSIVTVVDIGAHSGLFGIKSRLRFPWAIIHCYEPNPQMLPWIAHQADTWNLELFPEGVGPCLARGTVKPHGDSVCAQLSIGGSGCVSVVDLETVANRIGGHIDFLKMDCEGCEWPLLETASPWWRRVDRIAMEYHLTAERSFADLKGLLRARGFAVSRHLPGSDFGVVSAYRMDA